MEELEAPIERDAVISGVLVGCSGVPVATAVMLGDASALAVADGSADTVAVGVSLAPVLLIEADVLALA